MRLKKNIKKYKIWKKNSEENKCLVNRKRESRKKMWLKRVIERNKLREKEEIYEREKNSSKKKKTKQKP